MRRTWPRRSSASTPPCGLYRRARSFSSAPSSPSAAAARPGPESILNPGPDAPLLDVALRGGFHLIAEEPPREIVIGMYVIKPSVPSQ